MGAAVPVLAMGVDCHHVLAFQTGVESPYDAVGTATRSLGTGGQLPCS